MKLRALNLILIALVAVLVASCGGSGRADASEDNQQDSLTRQRSITKPGPDVQIRAREFLVTFEPGVGKSTLRTLLKRHDLWVIENIGPEEKDRRTVLLVAMNGHPAFGNSEARLQPAKGHGSSDVITAQNSEFSLLFTKMKSLLSEKTVLSLSFNEVMKLVTHQVDNPNDPAFDDQEWLNSSGPDPISAEQSWHFGSGSTEIRLGIVDTGISYSHPDFDDRVDFNISENFYMDDEPNTQIGGGATCSGHGTMVAGMAAATGDDDRFAAGLDWKTIIISLRVAEGDDANCEIDQANWTSAVQTIAEINSSADKEPIDVVNMSVRSTTASNEMRQAAEDAYSADESSTDRGALLIAAAGNGWLDEDEKGDSDPDDGDDLGVYDAFPAEYQTVAAVAALNVHYDKATIDTTPGDWGSNYGEAIEYSGQGVKTLTSGYAPELDQDIIDDPGGTSAAAPSVAGVATLGWSLAPEMENTEVRDILYDTGTDEVDDVNPDFAGQLGRHVKARNFVRTMRFEPNDDHPVENDENPEPLTLGEFHKSGAAYPSDQTDWYEFDGVSEGDDLLFTLNWEDSASDVDLLLYGPDRHLVKEGHSTGPTQMQVDFPDYHNQVAYIKVESFSEGASLYELKGEVTG